MDEDHIGLLDATQRAVDESIGRAMRETAAACAEHRLVIHIHDFRGDGSGTNLLPAFYVNATGRGGRIAVRKQSASLVDVLERTCDRINRQEWDT